MANEEHLKVFHRGVTAWNKWRSQHRGLQPDLSQADLRDTNLRLGNLNNANLRGANLEGANLGRAFLEAADLEGAQQRGVHLFGADLGRADLRHADLGEAQLWDVRLEQADLRDASLRAADLRHSDLSRADLRDAVLEGANLADAFLFHTDLRRADLRGARLERTRFWDCRLDGADLSGAVASHSAFNDVDLSQIHGVGDVEHAEPSSVGIDTLERTASGLARDPARQEEVEAFLRGAGVRESYLETFRQRVANSFGYFSAFIRYSQADQAFARRLYDELQSHGIRCWLHEHPMLPGDDVHESSGLGPWDRLLLCGSEASCGSWWIAGEIAHALEAEREATERQGSDVEVLIPLALDDYPTSRWQGTEAERLRARLAADFSGWADDGSVFDRALEQVVGALRIEP